MSSDSVQFDCVLRPGLQFKIPLLVWVQNVDYRVKTVNVQPQNILTKDNVTTMIDTIIFDQVKRDHDEVEDFDQVNKDTHCIPH